MNTAFTLVATLVTAAVLAELAAMLVKAHRRKPPTPEQDQAEAEGFPPPTPDPLETTADAIRAAVPAWKAYQAARAEAEAAHAALPTRGQSTAYPADQVQRVLTAWSALTAAADDLDQACAEVARAAEGAPGAPHTWEYAAALVGVDVSMWPGGPLGDYTGQSAERAPAQQEAHELVEEQGARVQVLTSHPW